ncbi:MAG: ParB/RepB/Spo0J family partition protein [Armatimonadota bacterium]|nr:ParB/RepB/Spo0J family partition protein [Armatimonadota bacterium]
MQLLDLDQIVATEGQPRKTFYKDSLEELARSIKERGVLEPIVVRPRNGKYEIVMGERRYRASVMAGLTQIPAIIRDLSDQDAKSDALLENFQREDLNPIEKARAIRELLTFMNWDKCCRTLGVSESTVRRFLELLELPESVQKELIAKDGGSGDTAFTEGHARLLRALNGDLGTQIRIVKKIKAEKLSIDETQKLLEAIADVPDKKEAFLRVPLNVTEEILRHTRRQAEKKKPFKPKTADLHIKSLERTASLMVDLLDERLVDFLNAVQMNQLLSTMSDLYTNVDKYAQMVRVALQKNDHGFKEVYVHCPLCGRIELIGSLKCGVCWSILRRCLDCGRYDQMYQRCGMSEQYVYLSDAENPKETSPSYKCPDYRPKYEARKAA